jgi:hypothetical protein
MKIDEEVSDSQDADDDPALLQSPICTTLRSVISPPCSQSQVGCGDTLGGGGI